MAISDTRRNFMEYVHQHALGFAIALGITAYLLAKLADGTEDGKAAGWGAALSGVAAAAIFIWYLADPWIKDEDLVKPLAMIEEVQGRLKLNPDDKAAKQAWQMIRDKMAEVDPETRGCVFARKYLKVAPSEALKVLAPDADQSALAMKLLNPNR
jgi:hypothetical protein